MKVYKTFKPWLRFWLVARGIRFHEVPTRITTRTPEKHGWPRFSGIEPVTWGLS
ncbi:hypothetical protein HMPREF9278_2000 [Mobiluncus mulieris FB024-16]|nr:hypothetical protein HMPREF9278_2000 [Mobiluncus mulieris FB024-16]